MCRFITTRVPNVEAATDCENDGGSLVAINNPQQGAQLINYINDNCKKSETVHYISGSSFQDKLVVVQSKFTNYSSNYEVKFYPTYAIFVYVNLLYKFW